MSRQLTLLPDRLSVCRLAASSPWPALPDHGFVSATRTADELSVVCEVGWRINGARRADGWRCLKIEGPFDLAETGVLAPLATALGEAGVSLLPIATFETDYLLVREPDLDRALDALAAAGCTITAASPSSPAA